MSKNNYLWVCFFTIIACSRSSDDAVVDFYHAEVRGKIENAVIKEASGLTAGINNPGLLWTHNDSGNDPVLFLMDGHGRDRGSFILEGVQNRDWEDIASGPGPETEKNYLYIAETGDNDAVYEHKYIYRLEEPLANDPERISTFDTITFKYPDGKRDAECLMLDPINKDLYVISKREANVSVYRAAYPQSITQIITLEKLGTIPYHNIVSGDISSDGKAILLKTYDKIFYWERDESLLETLHTTPLEITYDPEPQGESIAWKNDMSGFYTVSEERNNIEAVLYFYKKR